MNGIKPLKTILNPPLKVGDQIKVLEYYNCDGFVIRECTEQTITFIYDTDALLYDGGIIDMSSDTKDRWIKL